MTDDPQTNRPTTAATMRVKVNGEDRDVPAGSSVETLLAASNLQPRQVAVEVNRRLRRADRYGEPLADGDAVEIVTFVGGGC